MLHSKIPSVVIATLLLSVAHASPTDFVQKVWPATPLIQSADPSAFPRSTISHAWLQVSSDTLGNPSSVPLIIARGASDGPVLGITAALHGNEINGFETIRHLMDSLPIKELRGTIIAIPVMNPGGFALSQRGFPDDGKSDLNRIMPGEKNGTASKQYAYGLFHRAIAKFTHHIDLHTASRGHRNTMYVRADLRDPISASMATILRPNVLLHNTSPGGSLRGAAMAHNISSVTVEMGDPSVFQEEYIARTTMGIQKIISHLGMISHEISHADDVKTVIPETIKCAKSYWIFTDMGGLIKVLPPVGGVVKKGDAIAELRDAFGQLIRNYRAPQDGVVIGKTSDPAVTGGGRILHLGISGTTYDDVSRDGHE